jgi:hypothetical protein
MTPRIPPSREVKVQMAANLRTWMDEQEINLARDISDLATVEEDLGEDHGLRGLLFAMVDAINHRREELAAMRRQLDRLGLDTSQLTAEQSTDE